jgi:hypothetical protein
MARRARRRGERTDFGIFFDGPFFTADPALTFRKNLRGYMLELAKVGELEVKRRVANAPRRSPGPSFSGRYIQGRNTSRKGKPWVGTTVVSPNTTGLDGFKARRVMATLAGRHNPRTERRFVTGPTATPPGTYIGTTPGHEGNAKVFKATQAALRRWMRKNKDLLTKGIS